MKKVLILTLNDYIIYQPSILNLYDELVKHFEVEVISFQPYHLTKKKDEERNITYLQTGFWGTQFYKKMDFILPKFTGLIRKVFPRYTYHYFYYNSYLPGILRKKAKQYKGKADIIIAVDFQVLHLAQQLFGAVHFLSLEIDNNTNRFYKLIDTTKIKSVFVQSHMRYEYLFPGKKLPVFYVQNAQVFNGIKYVASKKKDFVWSGSIDKRLAVIECLEFFKAYPQYKMYMRGGANAKMLRRIKEDYKQLIDEKRIVIDHGYLKSDAFIDFLSHFRIGFCFYEWDLIHKSFNYLTAPSGKLFMNMAAGVPVIASNIPGFQLVKEFHAGVLVDDYEPATIYRAVQEIESDYEKYSAGCFEAARYFSFDKNVAPYVKFLLEDTTSK